jgi:hypothetical protein
MAGGKVLQETECADVLMPVALQSFAAGHTMWVIRQDQPAGINP